MKKLLFAFMFIIFMLTFIGCAHEHEFDMWKTIQEPTCIQDGSKERHCICCGEVESQILHATGEHSFDGMYCLVCNTKNPMADEIAIALKEIERYPKFIEISKELIETDYNLFDLTHNMNYFSNAYAEALDICDYLDKVIDIFEDYTEYDTFIKMLVEDSQECVDNMPSPPNYLSNASAKSYIRKFENFASEAEIVFICYDILCDNYGVQLTTP